MLEENQETIEADAQPVGFLERGAPNTGEAPQVVKALAGIGFLALIAAAIVSETWRKPLIVVAILLTIVIAHELGHFLIARRAGMACSEFFVGFGPRLWYRKRGETEFGLKLLPLGGYVRILGMTNLEKVDPALEKRTYRQAPFRWRFATIMGGVTVNFVLAFLCFWAVAAGQGEFGTSNRINQLVEKCRSLDDPNSPANTECPAAAAGIKADDVIVAIDGMKITTGKQVTASLEPRLGRRTEVTVMRKGRELSFTLIP
ncbi:MAG: site-2 protease family protein, partial [Acidimicrobiia bacterium]